MRRCPQAEESNLLRTLLAAAVLAVNLLEIFPV